MPIQSYGGKTLEGGGGGGGGGGVDLTPLGIRRVNVVTASKLSAKVKYNFWDTCHIIFVTYLTYILLFIRFYLPR